MILVNTDYISGKELEMLGLVKGSTIQSKNLGKDITQGLKTLVGGELKAYNEMMNEARALATKRMVAEAEELGRSSGDRLRASVIISQVWLRACQVPQGVASDRRDREGVQF